MLVTVKLTAKLIQGSGSKFIFKTESDETLKWFKLLLHASSPNSSAALWKPCLVSLSCHLTKRELKPVAVGKDLRRSWTWLAVTKPQSSIVTLNITRKQNNAYQSSLLLFSADRMSPAFSGHGYSEKQICEHKHSWVKRDLCQIFPPSLLCSHLLRKKKIHSQNIWLTLFSFWQEWSRCTYNSLKAFLSLLCRQFHNVFYRFHSLKRGKKINHNHTT